MVTAFQAYAGWSPRPGDALDRLPRAPPRAFETSPVAPAGLGQGLARDDGVFAVLSWARRDVPVALYAGRGSSLRLPFLCVDADGDGAFDSAGERRRVLGRKDDRGETWTGEFTVGGVPAVLSLLRTPTVRRALRLDGRAPRPLAQRPLPATSLAGPPGHEVVLLATHPGAQASVLIAWARGPEDACAVGVDVDGNGICEGPGEWHVAPRVERRGPTDVFRADDVPLGEARLRLALEERVSRTTGTLAPPGALRGTANLNGRQFALYLVDQDLDGAYTSGEDWWWFGPVERLAQLPELTPDTLLEGSEPAFIAGAPWRLHIVEADGTARVAPDPLGGTLSAYLERRAARTSARWEPRLEAEADAFRKANAIDPARPRAATPVAWRFSASLEEAEGWARREQRPLLALFEADWCPWCHRLALHTLADGEVAEVLARFTCVRLHHDLLVDHGFERHGGKGLPLVLLLDGRGGLLEVPGKLPGDPCRGAVVTAFEAPAVFAARLRAAARLYAPGER